MVQTSTSLVRRSSVGSSTNSATHRQFGRSSHQIRPSAPLRPTRRTPALHWGAAWKLLTYCHSCNELEFATQYGLPRICTTPLRTTSTRTPPCFKNSNLSGNSFRVRSMLVLGLPATSTGLSDLMSSSTLVQVGSKSTTSLPVLASSSLVTRRLTR